MKKKHLTYKEKSLTYGEWFRQRYWMFDFDKEVKEEEETKEEKVLKILRKYKENVKATRNSL